MSLTPCASGAPVQPEAVTLMNGGRGSGSAGHWVTGGIGAQGVTRVQLPDAEQVATGGPLKLGLQVPVQLLP